MPSQSESKEKQITLGEALALAANYFQTNDLETAQEVCTQILASAADNPDALHLMGLIHARRGNFADGIKYLKQAVEASPEHVEVHNNLGNLYKAAGQLAEAEQQYNRSLEIDPESFTAYYNIGTLREVQGKPKEAIESYEKALAINDEFALCHYNLANLFNHAGDLKRAESHYKKAVELDPEFVEANANLGSTQLQMNQLDEAIDSYRKALKEKPDSPDLLNNLGIILTHRGQIDDAIKAFNDAVKFKPDFVEAINNLALLLRDIGKVDEAVTHFRKAIKTDPKFYEAFNSLAETLMELGQYEEAVKLFNQSLAVKKDQPQTINWMAIALKNLGYYENAEKCFRTAQQMQPSNQLALLGICMISLRETFKKEEDVFFSRRKYLQVLQQIEPAPPFNDPRAMIDAAGAIGILQPYMLAVHAQNDVEMQRIYGGMVSRVMTQRYMDAAQPLPMPPLDSDGRIKVGIVTHRFYDNPVWHLIINGWLTQIDRKRFKLICYSTGGRRDAITDKARELADEFHQDFGFEPMLRRIFNERLHVLLYPEIGVDDPDSLKASALRLAPIQCLSWGHPETSGIANIDYFLSSELMEPEQSETHYVEKLVRLPKLGTYIAAPNTTPDESVAVNWPLRPNDTKYLCSAPLYKYLPQHDKIFPAITKAIPDAQFVFIKSPAHAWKPLKERLENEFTERKQSAENHLVFVDPPKNKEQFAALCAHSDIYLDPIGWSGTTATLYAMERGLPVVTLPGPIMRARHSAAFLQAAGITETVVPGVDEYIATAIKLGRDEKFWQAMSQQVKDKYQTLFQDKAPITALEDFLADLVAGKKA